MSVVEMMIDIPAEREKSICGQLDIYLEKVERTLHVTMIVRDGETKIIGLEQAIGQTKSALNNLIELSRRGNAIMEQNADYALSLSFTEKDGQILKIDKGAICKTVTGKPAEPRILGQRNYVDSIRKKMIVSGIGPTGTGKTYLAIAIAIQAFRSGGVGRIIFTYFAIEAEGKPGFLPDDLQSKIDLYLRPLYDALYQITRVETYLHNSEKGLVGVVPLAYMGGRTLDNIYVVLDKAQNATPTQMKMFFTRVGPDSKVIVTEDRTQKDPPSGAVSSLNTTLKVPKKIDGTGFCYLTSSNVVRHPLVQKIVQVYDAYEQKSKQRSEQRDESKNEQKGPGGEKCGCRPGAGMHREW